MSAQGYIPADNMCGTQMDRVDGHGRRMHSRIHQIRWMGVDGACTAAYLRYGGWAWTAHAQPHTSDRVDGRGRRMHSRIPQIGWMGMDGACTAAYLR